MKLSNKFTLTRILYAPIFVLLYFIPVWLKQSNSISAQTLSTISSIFMYITIPTLLFAEFTDFLDGHYARKHNEVSDFGKLFDPFADVILHLTTMICYMFSYSNEFSYAGIDGYILPILFMLIMIREFSQNFLRMVAAKKGIAIAARKGGKVKTVFYIFSGFFALFLEFLVRTNNIPSNFTTLKTISFVMWCICVVLSYASFIDYLIHFGKVFKEVK